jgi:hypothetical protein
VVDRPKLRYATHPPLCTTRIDCNTTIAPLVQRRRSLRELSTGLKFVGPVRRLNIESARTFRIADTPAGAHGQGARGIQGNVQKCPPGRMFFRSPRGVDVGRHIRAVPAHGHTNSTGLKTEWVLLKSLPRVPIPVHRCPTCGQMHKWDPHDAWVGPVQSRAPRLLSNSRAASYSASTGGDERTQKRDRVYSVVRAHPLRPGLRSGTEPQLSQLSRSLSESHGAL